MRTVTRGVLSLSGMILALGLAGCGSSPEASLSGPSAPHGATIQGTLDPGGATAQAAGVTAFSSKPPIRISVVGAGLTTTSDSSGKFVLTGVPAGTVVLRFEGPGIDARLEISGLNDGQVLTLTIHVSGGQAVIISDNTPPSPSPSPSASPSPSPSPSSSPGLSEVEFKGSIESLSLPSLRVAGRNVMTNGSTVVRRGGQRLSTADLKVGQIVEVEGRLGTDGVVVADKIQIEDDDNEDAEAEFKGRIESITPPALRVAGRNVTTDASTDIRNKDKRVSLSDLKVGQIVEVEGRLQANGSVLAKKIKVEDDDDD